MSSFHEREAAERRRILKVVEGGAEPPRARCDQFTFARVEGRLVAYHNGEECSVAEAAATVALIARGFYGETPANCLRPVELDGWEMGRQARSSESLFQQAPEHIPTPARGRDRRDVSGRAAKPAPATVDPADIGRTLSGQSDG